MNLVVACNCGLVIWTFSHMVSVVALPWQYLEYQEPGEHRANYHP